LFNFGNLHIVIPLIRNLSLLQQTISCRNGEVLMLLIMPNPKTLKAEKGFGF